MKIRMKFKKQGPVKFVGHLDIMRYFQKVMRRAEVDIRYSEGYSPHQIMSFAAPLGVGLVSNGEYVDIEVNSTGDSRTMLDRINAANVEGVEVTSYRRLPDDAKNAMSLVAAADYTVWFRDGYEPGMTGETAVSRDAAGGANGPDPAGCFWEKFVEFTGRDTIEVVKKTKKGEKTMDLKPYLYEVRTCRIEEEEKEAILKPAVFLKLAAGSAANIKPELVIGAFYESMGKQSPEFAFQIRREEVYAEESATKKLIPLEEYGEDIE